VKILITGGVGFIGTNLADRFLREGKEVVLFDNLRRPGVEQNLEWLRRQHGTRVNFVKGDVRDFDAVEKSMRGADVVFHLAAQVAVTTSIANPQEDFSINAQGALNVLEAARRQNQTPIILYTSTNKVYGGLDHLTVIEDSTRYKFENLPYGVSETCPLDFHSPYGCSKGAALSGLRELPLTIYGDGKQVRDLLYVEDLIDLMIRSCSAIKTTSGQVYNVGGGPTHTISVWAELKRPLEETIGKVPLVKYGEFRPGDQKIYVSDIRKAHRELGWSPQVGITTGLGRMVDGWGQGRKGVPAR